MNRDPVRNPARGVVFCLLATLTVAALVRVGGCTRPGNTTKSKEDYQGKAQNSEHYFKRALDRLRISSNSLTGGRVGLSGSKAAVGELNSYLKYRLKEEEANPPKDTPLLKDQLKLPGADRERLKTELSLDAGELAEVESKVFTPLDAYYLQFCYQMAEAARSLDLHGLPPLERARLGFEWVVRQVALKERFNNVEGRAVPDDLLPPQMVLELGHGTSQERALVFFALLRQMRLDGCMIAFPGREGGDPVYWIPGVLIDMDEQGKSVPPRIYLFDTRLGMPLPGTQGSPVARLDQVIRDPAAHRALFPRGGETVIPGQVRKADVLVACPLSALAPRLKHLEAEQAKQAQSDKMVVSVDPVALRKRFQQATNRPVRFWSGKGDPNTPTRVLRALLPPSEGGVGRGERGGLIRIRLDPKPAWHKHYPRALAPVLYSFLDEYVAQHLANHCYRARTLLVKGNIEEAVKPLVEGDTFLEILKSRYLTATPDQGKRDELQKAIDGWCKNVLEAQEAVNALLEESRDAGGKDPALQKRLQAARSRLNSLRSEDNKLFNLIAYTALREPLGKEAGYLLCLCLQEKAERAHARLLALRRDAADRPDQLTRARKEAADAWSNAQTRWSKFAAAFALDKQSFADRLEEIRTQARVVRVAVALYGALDLDISRSVASRLFEARAWEKMGHPEKALKLLEDHQRELEDMASSLGELKKVIGTDNASWLGITVSFQIDRLKGRG
jgi:hypothetical protein